MPRTAIAPQTDALDVIHMMLTAVMAWLCIILLLPGDTFAGSISFALMDRLATEAHWSLAFGITAVIGVAGMVTASRLLRLLSVVVVASVHGTFALCLLAANPANTGSGTYSIIAATGYYLAWRRARAGL